MAKKAKRQKHHRFDEEASQGDFSDDGDNTGDDYISLDPIDTRSRQQRRYEESLQNKKRKRQDYDSDNEEAKVEVVLPWLELVANTRSKLTLKKLFQREVDCFVQYLEPTSAEKLMRKYLVHKVRTVIEKRFKESTVEVFGSFETQLYLPNSDIDLVVQSPKHVNLRTLAMALVNAGVCKDPQVIEHAAVPVVKFQDSLTLLRVDITLNSDSGIISAQAIKKMMAQQPGLKPLTLIVKHYLALRKLNEVFTGGMGGYAIVCLVMSFLQMHPKVASGEIDALQNLDILLLDFFQLYGVNFNLEKVGICVKGKGSYYRKDRVLSRQGRPIFTIRDPTNPDNDLGMKSYNAMAVVKSFRFAYFAMSRKIFDLSEEMNGNHHVIRFSPENSVSKFSILSEILNIPVDMTQLREHIDSVYSGKEWQGEEAASTFDWGAHSG